MVADVVEGEEYEREEVVAENSFATREDADRPGPKAPVVPLVRMGRAW